MHRMFPLGKNVLPKVREAAESMLCSLDFVFKCE